MYPSSKEIIESTRSVRKQNSLAPSHYTNICGIQGPNPFIFSNNDEKNVEILPLMLFIKCCHRVWPIHQRESSAVNHNPDFSHTCLLLVVH